MLRVGDRFEFNGVKYVVLDIIQQGGSVYYKVRGECGAIKVYPSSIERATLLFKRL